MDNEWKIVERDGRKYRMKSVNTGYGWAHIYRPILTEEEEAVRIAALLDALQRFGKAAIDQGVNL